MNLTTIALLSLSSIPIYGIVKGLQKGVFSFRKSGYKLEKNTYKRRWTKGANGENAVSAQLRLLDKDEYRVYNDLLFNLKNDITIQIDHLVVSKTGIYVIETKNYGGVIEELDKDRWLQRWYKKEYNFYSPIKQNESHIRSLMYILFTKNRSLFKSFIVFPDKTNLLVKNAKIIHIKNLCRKIEENNTHILTDKEVQSICKKIETRNIYSKQNIKKHHKRVDNKYVDKVWR